MTPEKAKAQEKAIEALIGASLRAPDKETEVTDEEISRYVDQHVTLSSEDKSALESSKSSALQAIKHILQGNEQEHDCPTRPSKAERTEQPIPVKRKNTTDEFIEAIVIAQLTRLLAKPDWPLGRLRYNKLAYLSHRKAEDNVCEHYLKKAAGPYSPWAKYQGPENIAVKNEYVKRLKAGAKQGLVPGDKIGKIDQYLSHYPVCAAIEWIVSQFRFRKNEELELLATVDFAALDLIEQGSEISMENVKHVIAANTEWAPKLNREIFSELNITRALSELRDLFPATYA